MNVHIRHLLPCHPWWRNITFRAVQPHGWSSHLWCLSQCLTSHPRWRHTTCRAVQPHDRSNHLWCSFNWVVSKTLYNWNPSISFINDITYNYQKLNQSSKLVSYILILSLSLGLWYSHLVYCLHKLYVLSYTDTEMPAIWRGSMWRLKGNTLCEMVINHRFINNRDADEC